MRCGEACKYFRRLRIRQCKPSFGTTAMLLNEHALEWITSNYTRKADIDKGKPHYLQAIELYMVLHSFL